MVIISESQPNFTDLVGGPSAPVSDTLVGRQAPASSAAAGTGKPRPRASPWLPPSSQPATGRWTGSDRDLVTTLSSRFLVAAETASTAFPLITPNRVGSGRVGGGWGREGDGRGGEERSWFEEGIGGRGGKAPVSSPPPLRRKSADQIQRLL